MPNLSWARGVSVVVLLLSAGVRRVRWWARFAYFGVMIISDPVGDRRRLVDVGCCSPRSISVVWPFVRLFRG